MTNVKDVIMKLRAVRVEKDLSYDKILSMLEDDGEFISKSTLSRLFGDKWENYSFDYERTVLPIANIILDIDTIEADDDIDTKAYKSMLKFKMSIIDENARQIKELKEEIQTVRDKERAKYSEKLEKETIQFQHSLDFMTQQIQLKDKRIDMLMEANDRLSIMNNKMLEQFLSCPLKGECDK